jgi:non-heme Fe2+,alpha-ketoglutarate-dependent halogenase
MSRGLETFHQDGYSGPFTLFSPDVAAKLLARSQAEVFPVRCETYAHTQADPRCAAFRKTLDPMTRRDRHLDSPLMYRIASHPELLERVSHLLGPDVLLWRSDTFEQSAGDSPTTPHQDGVFEGMNPDPIIEAGEGQEAVGHQTLLSGGEAAIPLCVNVWIALTRVRKETGALWLVPGTHSGLIPKVPGVGFAGIDLVPSRVYAPDEGVALEMEAGQFVMFHNLIVHGSLPVQEGMRFAWVCRYVTPATQLYHRSKVGPQGQDMSRWGAVLVQGQDRARRNPMSAAPIVSAAPIADERALNR